jgi:hypothetical protein
MLGVGAINVGINGQGTKNTAGQASSGNWRIHQLEFPLTGWVKFANLLWNNYIESTYNATVVSIFPFI